MMFANDYCRLKDKGAVDISILRVASSRGRQFELNDPREESLKIKISACRAWFVTHGRRSSVLTSDSAPAHQRWPSAVYSPECV